MKTTVTRRDVIKALRTEPLRGGTYVHTESDMETTDGINYRTFKNKTGCAVCAVGSILDQAIGDQYSKHDLDRMGCELVKRPISNNERPESLKNLVETATGYSGRGYHLSALSILFEGLFEKSSYRTQAKLANAKLRRELIKFVKKTFPKKLTIDTDSGKEY